MIEKIEPVNAPSCYRISLLSSSLEVTARLKSVDDLDLLMNVLESNRALFVKTDRLAAEVLTLIYNSGSVPFRRGLSLWRRLRSADGISTAIAMIARTLGRRL